MVWFQENFLENYYQAVIYKTTKKQFYGKNFGQNKKYRAHLE